MRILRGALLAAFVGCSPDPEPPIPRPVSIPPVPKPAAVKPPAPPRINHEGRVLPPMPAITKPVVFDTPEADAILASMQICPKDSPWNEDVSARPLHPDSKRIVETIGAKLRFRYNHDMGFILVPPDQPKQALLKIEYVDESDPGPFPIPDNAPMEGWPLYSPDPLEKIQREGGGDRHVIMVDPVSMKLYEFFHAFRTDKGWTASSAAIFDLSSNALRPADWTSADAAGLPIFPAVVRYDECARGMVEHAMRVTLRRTHKSYVYPATHQAGHGKEPYLPRMGERFRLRKDFDISGFPPHAQAILKGLKKYGMILADNGIEWAISIAPDRRLQGLESFNEGKIRGSDFEVVLTTGPNEGPRAPR